MHTGRNYTLFETINWTRRSIIIFLITSTIPVILYEVVGLCWISIPWIPIALIGTAVAFYLGFKNNSSYERLWEARKIWGGIVNTSRSWGILVRNYISNEHALEKLSEKELYAIQKKLIYRHIAWLYALSGQLRKIKSWEHQDSLSKNSRSWLGTDKIPDLNDSLKEFVSQDEIDYVKQKQNPAAQLISLQSKELRELKEKGLIWEFSFLELQNQLVELYTLQGKSERIKNFPFPRQYATVNLIFIWLFIILVPFGMLNEFNKIGEYFVWLTIPFSVMTCWVFHTMEMIGDYSENPFEGLWNDVPINALTRTIEIDLRDMLDETELPAPLKPIERMDLLL